MPVNPSEYNDDAIKCDKLQKLMQLEIGDRVLGDQPQALAEVISQLAARLDAVENAVKEKNIGERIADSLDAQVLKEGGSPVLTEATAATVARTGSYNDLSGTPSVPAAATATPQDVANSAAVGSSSKYAREDHKHKITVATGDSQGQVKIAGQNVSVNGFTPIYVLDAPQQTYETNAIYLI